MKRLIIIIFLILLIALVIIYFFLPASGKVAVNRNIKSSNKGIYRTVVNQQIWNKWFSNDIRITKPLLNAAETEIISGNRIANGNILLVSATNDSTQVYWNAEIPAYNRLTGYASLKELQNKIDIALDSLQAYTEKTQNVYGIDIMQQPTKDTLLLTVRFSSPSYPDVKEIYNRINELKNTILALNAQAVGHPMLNVSAIDTSSYKCMIAIPVNKKLDHPSFVRMIPGRFLTAKVKGGPHTIRHAHEMMQQYFLDYHRTSMAIPFEYLITDRSAESDTTKWLTEIYAPVY